MADDDRRAEIEAATDALLADSGLPRYGGHRATIERRMVIAFDAADRVRDARDDEAGQRFWCPDCGASEIHHDWCEAFPGEPVVHGNREAPTARSPQGEDHGPREIAAWLRQEHEAEHRVDTLAGVARRIEEHYGY